MRLSPSNALLLLVMLVVATACSSGTDDVESQPTVTLGSSPATDSSTSDVSTTPANEAEAVAAAAIESFPAQHGMDIADADVVFVPAELDTSEISDLTGNGFQITHDRPADDVPFWEIAEVENGGSYWRQDCFI